jgi:hypothetical protein
MLFRGFEASLFNLNNSSSLASGLNVDDLNGGSSINTNFRSSPSALSSKVDED